MAQSNAIKCKHCKETHTLSEGCNGGIARKRAALEQATCVCPTCGDPHKRGTSVPIIPSVPIRTANNGTGEPNNGTPTAGGRRRGRPASGTTKAERQAAYRARKRGTSGTATHN